MCVCVFERVRDCVKIKCFILARIFPVISLKTKYKMKVEVSKKAHAHTHASHNAKTYQTNDKLSIFVDFSLPLTKLVAT